MQNINWYPGHMAKARREIMEQLKNVDVVVELCDARAPRASRNPDLDAMIARKRRMLALNKADMADPAITRMWVDHFRAEGVETLPFMSINGRTNEVIATLNRLTQPIVDAMKARGVNKTLRVMVIGTPNVGKSTFINRFHGSAVTKTADRPGVTRSQRWVRVSPLMMMLDTPGMLWPRLNDQRAAMMMGFLGSVRDEVIDKERLAGMMLTELCNIAPDAVDARFKLNGARGDAHELLKAACLGRGWLLSGGRMDYERASTLILDEFRAGKVGRISLEKP